MVFPLTKFPCINLFVTVLWLFVLCSCILPLIKFIKWLRYQIKVKGCETLINPPLLVFLDSNKGNVPSSKNTHQNVEQNFLENTRNEDTKKHEMNNYENIRDGDERIDEKKDVSSIRQGVSEGLSLYSFKDLLGLEMQLEHVVTP